MSDLGNDRAQVFDALYTRDSDPWNVTTSDYERNKYTATLAALPPDRRFQNALDIGCSFGTLTRLIARRCASITGVDVSKVAIEKAREECAPSIRFIRGEMPAIWPQARYDLILLSEILYFLNAGEIARMADLVKRDLMADGICLLVNWTGPNDLPLSGDQAADLFIRSLGRKSVSPAATARHENFRIDTIRSDYDNRQS
ncbi:MAG: SAM-dependent methyltransferase [Pontixanthobacter sp.]